MLNQDRVDACVAEFNGAIKYTPMLADHPEWTEEECVAYADRWHPIAIAQLREAFAKDRAGKGNWHNQSPCWNDRIPYCRNLPTLAMIEEAFK